MKALVFNGPKDIRYETYDDPIISNDQNLVIKVDCCSICGSDLHLYHGDQVGPVDYSKPVERFCTGHETIGEVVEVGKGVRRHKPGDRIIVSGGSGCGQCKRCLSGHFNQCEQLARDGILPVYGTQAAFQGGHAEYLQVISADTAACTIPEGVSDEQAVLLTDALVSGYYGVKNAGVSVGDTVAVIGQGPVGLMAAESAMAIGASKVYTIDPVATRREKSRRFGATPLDPDQALDYIQEDTKGLGVDAVIEAVGAGATVNMAMHLARLGGRISIVGIVQPDVVIPIQLTQMKSLRLHSGIAGVGATWPDLIPLVAAGRITGEGVFTHQYSLSEGAEAFRLFDAHEDGVMKVMMTP